MNENIKILYLRVLKYNFSPSLISKWDDVTSVLVTGDTNDSAQVLHLFTCIDLSLAEAHRNSFVKKLYSIDFWSVDDLF